VTAPLPSRSREGYAPPVRRPEARPRLRAVPPLRPSPRAGLLACAVILMVFGLLLGAVMVNSKLITGQQDLDRIDKAITKADAVHDRLRLKVAQLESPERIVEAAKGQGMIPAAQTIWVVPVVPDNPPVTSPTPAPTSPSPWGAEQASGRVGAPEPAQP